MRASGSPQVLPMIPREWWNTTSRYRGDLLRDSVMERVTPPQMMRRPNISFQPTRMEKRAAEAQALGLSGCRCYLKVPGDRMETDQSVVHSDRDILGGTPVFVGTRVPLQALLDYLEAGRPLDEFLDDFPSVTREQAVAALEEAKRVLVSRARAAG